MDLFKGFIKTNGKKAVEPFKNISKLKTLEEVKNFNSYGGVLADSTVLIDIDDSKQAENLLNIVDSMGLRCRVNKTTRGMHFFFLNDGSLTKCYTGVKLAIGFIADIKIGTKNSYAILKKDNEEREVLYDKFPDEEYQPIPLWLRVVSTKIDLLNLEPGEGRNSKLFSYILILQKAGLSKEETIECLKIINKFIFAEPLSSTEFKTITRDEAFQPDVPDFYNGKQFLFQDFAKYLVNQLHIKRINGQLHIYCEGIYCDGFQLIEHEMIRLLPELNRAKRAEVLSYIDLLVTHNTKITNANLIAFKNGLYDIATDKLMDFSPEYVITNKIDWNYTPNAYSELVDNVLNKLSCNDSEIRSILEELIGYCFYRRNELRKAFILTGAKANGKSTFIAMIQAVLGDENISALDLKEVGDRFKTAELFRKLANIGDDIDDDFISNTAIFKKLVTGDRLNAERKGQDPFEFNNYSKFIFSANNLPRVKDRTGAVIDRLIIVPFNATFDKSDKDYDPFIKYKLIQPECVEYLITLGVSGLKRVLTNNEFTKSGKVELERNEYNELNNPVLGFFKEWSVDNMLREPLSVSYTNYSEYCLSNNFQPLSRVEFSRQLKKQFPNLEIKQRKINGKVVRMVEEHEG